MVSIQPTSTLLKCPVCQKYGTLPGDECVKLIRLSAVEASGTDGKQRLSSGYRWPFSSIEQLASHFWTPYILSIFLFTGNVSASEFTEYVLTRRKTTKALDMH